MTSIILTLFSAQQEINNLLIQKLNHLSIFSFIIAFTGGLLTSVSPCIVSSIPIVAIYLNQQEYRFYHTTFLFAGILTSFLGIGISSLFIKQYTWSFLGTIPFLWPALFIVIGLGVLNIIPINVLSSNNIITSKDDHNTTVLNSYLLGTIVGVTISPCSTPITITLLAWITATQQYIEGLYLIFIYSIGYMIPLLILVLSLKNLSIVHLMSQNSYIITYIMGCITLTVGSYSLFKEFLVLL
uniref:Thiol:disulfi de interchange protein n=1 Tax=Izziella formosana TaxID=1653389 RepID=A0A1G4NUI3_9FLOR|nr:Thiol:disulfi de interchange protein [Izziella formosana]SCW22274.1 Thiol:disulfi de interchange protein [Izziella formosana]